MEFFQLNNVGEFVMMLCKAFMNIDLSKLSGKLPDFLDEKTS